MTKLCPRGKAAAKRKFKVYPSAYANAYASKICAGKIPTTPKEKKLAALAPPKDRITYGDVVTGRKGSGRTMARGGGLMEATQRLRRQGLRGGGLCKKGMNREAIGKNS